MSDNGFDDLTAEIVARPGASERIAADVSRMNRVLALEALRSARRLTQAEVAERMGIGQRRVSAIEHSDEASLKIETLRRYVESLGGQLEIVAVVDGERIDLSVA